MAGTSELASLVARLEVVTSKLEGIAAGSGGDDGSGKLKHCNNGISNFVYQLVIFVLFNTRAGSPHI